jgi:hypothetical protein
VYRDAGDEYVTRSFDFTVDLDRFRAAAPSACGRGEDPTTPSAAALALTLPDAHVHLVFAENWGVTFALSY